MPTVQDGAGWRTGGPAPLDKGHQRDRPPWQVTMASASGQKRRAAHFLLAAQFLCEVTDTSISHPGLVWLSSAVVGVYR
jgi:hypothetical protein